MSSTTLLDFLSDPGSYPEGPEQVHCVETHLSWVFVTDQYVYKVKKPLRNDFVDFSTLPLREKACQKEIRVNARLAPEVYLDTLALFETQEPDGDGGNEGETGWSFTNSADPTVTPSEYCVRSRRLADEQFLECLLAQDQVTADDITRLADVLQKFFSAAKTSDKIQRVGAPGSIETTLRSQLKGLRELFPHSADLDRMESAQLEFVGRFTELFEERVRLGKIRDGHGDLRVDHVCMSDPIVIFDAVEFSDRLRYVDLIDDIANLVMDLDCHDRSDLGRMLWGTLADQLGEEGDSPLFDYYRGFRAGLRARCLGIRSQQLLAAGDAEKAATFQERALHYLSKGADYCQRFHTPRLILTVGMMGAGKTTLSQALGNELGIRPVTWELARKEATEHLAAAGTRPTPPQLTEQTYAEMLQRAKTLLSRGVSVILDGSFLSRAQRAAALEVGKQTGARSLVLDCRLPKSDAIARLDQRFRKDRTNRETRPELYDDQLAQFEPVDELPSNLVITLNTMQSVPSLVQTVLNHL